MNPEASERLLSLLARLLELRLFYVQYQEVEVALNEMMRAAGVREINLPGQGKVILEEDGLLVIVETIAFLRPFI